MDQVRYVLNEFERRHAVWKLLSGDASARWIDQIITVADAIGDALADGGRILAFGNGGSATHAQHLVGELVGRFRHDRRALPAIALTADTSIITAQANDSGFESIFSRQVEAYGRAGDIAIGFTTSDALEYGNHSRNILSAFTIANKIGLITIGFFSSKTQNLLHYVDHSIIAPSDDTAIIQDLHQSFLHILCGLIEERIIPK